MISRIGLLSRRLLNTGRLRFSEDCKAKLASLNGSLKKKNTIFDKIISKEIPAKIIHEDVKCLAFYDVNPQANVHILLIPKKKISMLENITEHDCELIGHLMKVAGELGKKSSPRGFRIVVNNGVEGCQSIYYLHIHIIGGQQLTWPPGV